MIIQIRGTSGSGKSTIVKQILGFSETVKPVMRTGRKQPIAYRIGFDPEIAIIGHYETKCGGCDTISTPGQSYPIIFDLIRHNAEAGRNVLFEGLLISGDVKWSSQLVDLDFRIIELTTSLEQCLESVNTRRMARLGDKFTPLNPLNTVTKHKLIQRSCEKLEKEFKIQVARLDREAAMDKVMEWLNVR